jgi:hypothetical protein
MVRAVFVGLGMLGAAVAQCEFGVSLYELGGMLMSSC